jgi:hypothetical protein
MFSGGAWCFVLVFQGLPFLVVSFGVLLVPEDLA